MGINLASYVGATSVRAHGAGRCRRAAHSGATRPDAGAGARGHATTAPWGSRRALEYAPAPYAKTEELIALAAEAAPLRRHLCHAHAQRGRRGDGSPIDEAVRIGREAHIPVEIWHLKAAGQGQLGQDAADRRADRAARAAGVDISANTYAYTAWFNDILRLHSAVGARRRGREARSSGSRIRPRAPASGSDLQNPGKDSTGETGTTNGRRSRVPKRS